MSVDLLCHKFLQEPGTFIISSRSQFRDFYHIYSSVSPNEGERESCKADLHISSSRGSFPFAYEESEIIFGDGARVESKFMATHSWRASGFDYWFLMKSKTICQCDAEKLQGGGEKSSSASEGELMRSS